MTFRTPSGGSAMIARRRNAPVRALAALHLLLALACGGEGGGRSAQIVDPDAQVVDARPVAPDAATDARALPDVREAPPPDAAPSPPDARSPDVAPPVPDALEPDALALPADAAPPPPDLAPDAAPDMAPDAAPPPTVPPSVMRVLAFPGGGVQIYAELPGGQAAPEIWLQSPREPRVETVVASAGLTTGYTAILLVPAEDPAEHLVRRVLADVLIDALPPGERVAVLMAGADAPVLLAEASLDRAHAHTQLADFRAEAGRTAAPLLDAVRERMDDLESRYTTPGRTLIVVGEAVAEPPPGTPRTVQTLSIGAVGDFEADAAALVAELQARRAAIVRIGACPGLAEDEIMALHAAETLQVLDAPEPMDHLAAVPCDARAAADDTYPFPTEISLTFTPDERVVYDAAYAAASIEPFPTSVTLGVGAPIPAVGHFHGMGTLGCERKSITVELSGPRRRLAPDLAADRFILISMCQDLRYFGQAFGNRLLAEMGLFPSPFKYVRVRLDGVNLGVYLLVYQAERAFRDTSLGLSTVVRRGYDIDAWPAEVKYPSDPIEAEAARLRFEEIGDLTLSQAPESLEDLLDARLEFDGYLRLLAAFSLLENGDFIDEAFFAGSLEADGERFRIMAWDTDDLWSACHADGTRAILDTCGVTYCTEAEVDQSLLRSVEVYQRYLGVLTQLLDALSAERLAAQMAEVQAELFAVLSDDETAAANTEMVYENPALATLEAARLDISANMEAVLIRTEQRRATLLAALAVCPIAPR
jgi:hypothetical protein